MNLASSFLSGLFSRYPRALGLQLCKHVYMYVYIYIYIYIYIYMCVCVCLFGNRSYLGYVNRQGYEKPVQILQHQAVL